MELLSDLLVERVMYPAWKAYYDGKIAEMREAIYGSGTGVEQAGSTSVQDVPRSDAQTL